MISQNHSRHPENLQNLSNTYLSKIHVYIFTRAVIRLPLDMNFGEILMTELDKGSKGFEKLLLALDRHCKDQTLQNQKWVNIWCEVADYRSYCFIHKKNDYESSLLQANISTNISEISSGKHISKT